MNKTNLNEFGQEVLDPRPLSIPVGFQRPPTLQEQIRRLMRFEYENIRNAGVDDVETPEEAEDFDTGEDLDIQSPYEIDDDPVVVPTSTLREEIEEIQKEDNNTSEENPPGANSEASSA